MSISISLATQEELYSYYKHLNTILLEQNGRNGIPYFSPRTELPEDKDAYLKKFTDSFKEEDPKKRENILFLAKKGDHIVGNLFLQKMPLESLSHRIQINGLGVDIAFHGQGIGKELMNEAIRFSKELQGIDYLELGVTKINAIAIELYEKLGFEIISEIEDEFRIEGEKLTSLTMRLDLNS